MLYKEQLGNHFKYQDRNKQTLNCQICLYGKNWLKKVIGRLSLVCRAKPEFSKSCLNCFPVDINSLNSVKDLILNCQYFDMRQQLYY